MLNQTKNTPERVAGTTVASAATAPPQPPHYIAQLPYEDEVRLEKLFKQLDVNGDGKIDISDLSEALQKMGVPHVPGYAEKFIERSDVAKSGYVDLSEFVTYIMEHEKNLRLVFHSLDENKDGRIDLEELITAFKKLGIAVDRAEAKNLLKRMDRDGTLEIDFLEWRDYLLFHPSSELHDIISYWRHATGQRNAHSCVCDIRLDSAQITEELFSAFKSNNYYSTSVSSFIEQCLDIGEDSLVPDDFTETEMISGMWWRHLVSGGVAGAISRTCTAPLDRLKVFLQVHGRRHFDSIQSCLRHMLHEGGLKSMWRGNGINVLKIAPESALKFMAYEQIKRFIRHNSNRELGIYERFIAGSIAGGVSQTVIYPLEVLKTRLALRKTGQYRGIFDAAKRIYRTEGFKSFYRGYVPNLLGIIPYAGIDLAVYETLKKFYLQNHSGDNSPGVLVFLTCGTISSTCGQIASYPLALVRTRLQAQAVTELKADATMSTLFRSIVQTEGLPGLYRGIAPNFMKVAPAVSISYVVYEQCRHSLGVSMT